MSYPRLIKWDHIGGSSSEVQYDGWNYHRKCNSNWLDYSVRLNPFEMIERGSEKKEEVAFLVSQSLPHGLR